MKKVLVFVLAALIAMTTMACIIPSNALYVKTSDDLLEESGLGDPEFLYDNSEYVKVGTTDEDWESNEQSSLWCGFSGGYGSVYSTREVAETTLSGGTNGKALIQSNDNASGTSGCHIALTHIADIANIEGGKTYQFVVTIKATGTYNGSNKPTIFYTGAEKVEGEVPKIVYEADGVWHTFEYTFTTPADGYDGYLYLGAQDNWMDPNASIAIESVKLYEVESDGEILNWQPTSACLAGDEWSAQPGKFWAPLRCPDLGTAGEAKDADGNRVYPTKEIATATLPDGSEGDVVRLAVEAVEGYVNFGNLYDLSSSGLTTNKDYTAIVEVKLTNPNPRGNVVVAYGTTSQTISASEEWQKIAITFNSGDTIGNLTIGPEGMTGEAGAGYELLIASMRIYEADKVPETSDNTAVLAVAAAFSIALMATVVFTKKKAF